jgi:hypothetical protein
MKHKNQLSIIYLRPTYPANDIIVISEVRFAVLAPKNLIGSEINVVRETHDDDYFHYILFLLVFLGDVSSVFEGLL